MDSLRIRFFVSCLTPILKMVWLVNLIFPVSFHPTDRILKSFFELCYWYMFILGFNMPFDFKKLSLLKRIFYAITTPIWVHYWDFCEAIALVWAVVTPITEFQIIKKNL